VPASKLFCLILLLGAIAGLTSCSTNDRTTAEGELTAEQLSGMGLSGKAAGFNVLLITVDTLRADHLGCYGHDSADTPAIDGLAEKGIRFDQAVASAPITLPVRRRTPAMARLALRGPTEPARGLSPEAV
jgi:hypothetical protein